MAKWADWVGFGLGQLGCGSKVVILSRLKMGSVAGWVDSYFSHEFFLIKKQHLFAIWNVMQQINYLM